ncbi:unnamed protein product [Amoebophrya sp. A25]|nr:unnamed protein product [Amoebophrya sp. A25]|eukprot:GSA25T00002568001.1
MTMTATEKTTVKTAIATALHESCCGPVVGTGKPFSTLANRTSVNGENGVATVMAMSWSGILAMRQSRALLAAVPMTGQFEISSTYASTITSAKDDMVSATTGGSPTLLTTSIAAAVTSGITTAVAGTSSAS